MSNKPIYLYIKTHNKTGLKYFGKTTQKNPHKYRGSGKHWVAHLKKHGADYTTEIYGHYTDEQQCLKEALEFSKKHNIVNSVEWANLLVESLAGGDTSKTKGYKKSLYKIAENGKKSKWWNNGLHQTFSEFPPNSTYLRGRLPFNNVGARLGAKIQKGKIWVNDGVNEKMIYPEELSDSTQLGRLTSKAFAGGNGRHSTKGSKWWNNGTSSKMSTVCPGPDYTLGRLVSKTLTPVNTIKLSRQII